jgi:hypothetical protein
MNYDERLWISPILRLVYMVYHPLLAELPPEKDAEIHTLDLIDDSNTEVIGAGIISGDDRYRVYMHAKELEAGHLHVQYQMLTKEEDDKLDGVDLVGPSDAIVIDNDIAFALFIRRLVSFLAFGVKPTSLDGDGE